MSTFKSTVVKRWRLLGYNHARSLSVAPYNSLRTCAPKWGGEGLQFVFSGLPLAMRETSALHLIAN